MSVVIPHQEMKFEFVRSGGAGGQNVNKVATKVQLSWNVFRSRVFTDAQKHRIVSKLSSLMNWRGEVIVMASSERSQAQNRTAVIAKLQALVRKALVVPKKRKATKPTRGSKEKRLEGKKIRSRLKKLRSPKSVWF